MLSQHELEHGRGAGASLRADANRPSAKTIDLAPTVRNSLRHATRRAALQSMAGALALLLLCGTARPDSNQAGNSSLLAYIGTYTKTSSKGIYSVRFDPATGKLTGLTLAAQITDPSFLVTDPKSRFLYAVSEIGYKDGGGTISSFAIDPRSGALKFLDKVPSRGGGPCHLVVDHTDKFLIVANYGTGSVAAFQINPDGSLGESTALVQHSGTSVNPKRQSGPHAHEVVLSPDNRFLFVPDLGLDQIKIYRFDARHGTLTPNDPPFVKVTSGAGPRHFALAGGAHFAYAVCEMGSAVTVFSYDRANGTLKSLQYVSNLPDDFKGEDNSAEIQVSRSGRFLYASNRGHDSVTLFDIDPAKGTLTRAQVISTEGKMPRNFVIDPTGRYLLAANQQSDQIVVFKIDSQTGKLTPSGEKLEIPSPVCIQFVALR